MIWDGGPSEAMPVSILRILNSDRLETNLHETATAKLKIGNSRD